MKLPKGFLYAGVSAGIKPHRKDVALVTSTVPAAGAGCFTVNKAKAAPCLDAEKRLPMEGLRAVVINSGNANALTGNAGLETVQAVHASAETELQVPQGTVVSASTGVIGVRLPAEKITTAMPTLVASLREPPEDAADAILTTDTRRKMAHRVLTLDGREVRVLAIAKGSGMIAPQLATMIVVITTDCAIEASLLQHALVDAMAPSFNSLTVDDDMSTNDAVFALANGQAGNTRITTQNSDFIAFSNTLRDLCGELTRAIAADGEGATKRLETQVTGAPSALVAKDIALAITGSYLVKSALFGADPNWGRVLATVGARAGSQGYAVNPYRARVIIHGVVVYDGGPVNHDKSLLRARMREPEVKVEVNLAEKGPGDWTAWGCDLSYDYVKINADYTSLVVETPTGGVKKDDRLSNYSPAFKVSLLVEALGYISRFRGQRCVIACGDAPMTKDSLKRTFCEDVLLLRSVGLAPLVVHGDAPEILTALDRLGAAAQFVDGERLTPASDLKVMEMVMTGSISAELVSLLNRSGGHAVGLSGKDAALLRAKKHVRGDGKDLGQIGELVGVNADYLALMLDRGYVPVISPVGIGDDGESLDLHPEDVAAGVASAVNAEKLVYLTEAPGLLDGTEVVSEFTVEALRTKVASGAFSPTDERVARAALRAATAGVKNIHILDGRVPHAIIAELFTDNGVGTLLRANA